MSRQSVDRYGAADFLGISDAAVTYRINHGTFPKPDATEEGVDWWEANTLDKYLRSLKRKTRAKAKR